MKILSHLDHQLATNLWKPSFPFQKCFAISRLFTVVTLIFTMGFISLFLPKAGYTQANLGERIFRGYEIKTTPENSAWDLFPSKLLYPAYLANPQRPKFSFKRLSVDDSQIPETGNSRLHLSAGHRFGLLRYGPWQFDFTAGIFSDFDLDNSQDNIGWDGIFGWVLSRQLTESTVAKVGFRHQSSHRGDEFLQRTGVQGMRLKFPRIDYTRNEFNVGLSHYFFSRLRLYGEVGWASSVNNEEIQDDGRLQWGSEFTQPYPVWNYPTGFFFAGDFQSLEERDWNVTTNLQTGVFLMEPVTTWRVGFEFRDGHPVIGEFIQNDETYLGFGLWVDFFDPRNPF